MSLVYRLSMLTDNFQYIPVCTSYVWIMQRKIRRFVSLNWMPLLLNRCVTKKILWHCIRGSGTTSSLSVLPWLTSTSVWEFLSLFGCLLYEFNHALPLCLHYLTLPLPPFLGLHHHTPSPTTPLSQSDQDLAPRPKQEVLFLIDQLPEHSLSVL